MGGEGCTREALWPHTIFRISPGNFPYIEEKLSSMFLYDPSGSRSHTLK